MGDAAAVDRWNNLAGGVSIAMGVLFGSALVGLSRQPLSADAAPYLPVVQVFLLPLVIALIGGALLAFRSRRREALVFITALTLAAYGMLVAATVRQWDRISPWRPIARVVNEIEAPQIRVLILGERTPFAEFYIERRVGVVDRAGPARAWGARPAVGGISGEWLAALAGGPA